MTDIKLMTKDIQEAVKEWLDARQKMMVAFNQICMLRPLSNLSQTEAQRTIEHFCTEVIDYLSFGQFKVFENLTKIIPPDSKDARTVKILLSKIFSSTIQTIEFHDQYMKVFSMDTIEEDLSKLGEQLAFRLDWEDQLLDLAYEHIYAVSPPLKRDGLT